MKQFRASKLVIIYSFFGILALSLFQNCAQKQNLSFSAMSASECDSNTAICVGDKKIVFLNQILTNLGTPSLNVGDQYVNGFLPVYIKNQFSGREGFIKIRFNSQGELEVHRDETKTDYDWVCLDHKQPKCALINGVTNCYSSIHAYDGSKVVTLRSSPEVPQLVACAASSDGVNFEETKKGDDTKSMNFEVLNSNHVAASNADLDALYKGCRIKFKDPEASHVSPSLINNYKGDVWFRTSVSPKDCNCPAESIYECKMDQTSNEYK